MPGIFDKKHFNDEVFTGYMETIENPKLNQLIKSKALRPRPDLKTSMADQVGGNYITTILQGLIGSGAPQNYDGQTDAQSQSTQTYKQGRVVVGRMAAFTEKDFTTDITGGKDPMVNVAEQLSDYWDDVDQNTLVAILTGIFRMSDEEGKKFVEEHTYDITKLENSEGVIGHADATSLNTCMQRSCGDKKAKFSLTVMHSVVGTNLENLKILKYAKYNDEKGMEREVALATLNGRAVLIDDGMPVKDVPASDAVDAVEAVQGVYTLNISAAAKEGDKIVVTFGENASISYTADGDTTAANVAKTLRTILSSVAGFADVFTIGGTGANITFTQKVGGTGAAPTATVTQADSGTLAATVATTTPGVAAVEAKAAVSAHKEYTTYVLGDGAIEFTNCGAKVANEVDRDPKTNGGQDTLYSRQRKCFAPFGISFTMAHMNSLSPTDEELVNGENWELVSADLGDGIKEAIPHKLIPIARIISLG